MQSCVYAFANKGPNVCLIMKNRENMLRVSAVKVLKMCIRENLKYLMCPYLFIGCIFAMSLPRMQLWLCYAIGV
jgi:hypothetical protein